MAAPMSHRPSFPQHRLDVYRVAVELAQKTREAAKSIPRGDRSLADQMKRAATSTVLLIAEGANRHCLLDGEQVIELLDLAGRTNAMLLRLEQRFGGVKP